MSGDDYYFYYDEQLSIDDYFTTTAEDLIESHWEAAFPRTLALPSRNLSECSNGRQDMNMHHHVNNSTPDIDASMAEYDHIENDIGNYRDSMLGDLSQEDRTLILNGPDLDPRSLSEERNGGLAEKLITKYLKTRNCNEKDEESKICVVCQDDLCQEKQKIATLECGHEYHSPCIKSWLKRKNICPLCNAVGLRCR